MHGRKINVGDNGRVDVKEENVGSGGFDGEVGESEVLKVGDKRRRC